MHRWLLRLYPASFRNEYGEELRRVFARRRRDATGPAAVAGVWLGETADTALAAGKVHLDILRQDLRHTRRSLGRARGFALTVVLVTALGVGATTAVFSLADYVLVRPLPFANPERIVKIWQSQPDYSRMDVSPANFRDWRAMTSSFSEMGAYTEGQSANLVGAGEPAKLNGSDVTAALLPIFGVAPESGRLFLPEDDRDGAPGTVILSDAVWRVKFGADPAIVGKTLTLDDEACTVIGVMPPSFEFPSRTTDFWRPIRFPPDIFEDRSNLFLRVIARLKPGVSRSEARAELTAVAAKLERLYPKENAKIGATLIDLRDEVGVRSRQMLTALMLASACVLLIACTNLASLIVARTSAREREIAVRTALGAGRERLVRQLMTESLVLAIAGGMLGVLVAVTVVPLIAIVVPTSLPIGAAPALDLRMLATAAIVTLATGVGFGVLPALRVARQSAALRDGARAGTSRRTERLRGALVIAQVAASVALLVSAGLLVRALWNVQHVDPGFRTDGVLTLSTPLPMPKYAPQAVRVAFYRRVLDDIRALPGVSAAAYTSFLPMSSMRGGIWPAYMPGETHDAGHGDTVSVRYITPQFFDAMRIPVKLGRALADTDGLNNEKVVVVSESFATAHWPGTSPIGRRFFVALFDRTIVGVVGDVRVRGLERESEPQVYLPYQQQLDDMMTFYTPKDLVVRQDARMAPVAQAVREIIARADPQLPVSEVSSLASVVLDDTAARSAQVRVLGAFAALACVLAAIGLHGLLAFVVLARTREIGVRLALGAEPRDVMALIASRGAMMAAAGVVLGAIAAIVAGRSMQALLVGVQPADPATLGAAVAVTLVMALAGSLIPTLRAARIEPTEALRAD